MHILRVYYPKVYTVVASSLLYAVLHLEFDEKLMESSLGDKDPSKVQSICGLKRASNPATTQ